MQKVNRYVMVDDDPIDIFICHTILKKELGEPEFHHFTRVQNAIHYFESEFSNSNHSSPIILFLDLNMAAMDGWDFLDHFDKMEENIKKTTTIYVFSSSIDHHDQEKALKNRYVADYIIKPLVSHRVRHILANVALKSNVQ